MTTTTNPATPTRSPGQAAAWEDFVANAGADALFEWTDPDGTPRLCTIEGWDRYDDDPREFQVRFLTPWSPEGRPRRTIERYEGVPAANLRYPDADTLHGEMLAAMTAADDAEERAARAAIEATAARALAARLEALAGDA